MNTIYYNRLKFHIAEDNMSNKDNIMTAFRIGYNEDMIQVDFKKDIDSSETQTINIEPNLLQPFLIDLFQIGIAYSKKYDVVLPGLNLDNFDINIEEDQI